MNQADHVSLERMLPVDDALTALGCRRTKLYELIEAGHLDARKLGRHTRITASSIAAYQASMPKAEIGAGRRQAA